MRRNKKILTYLTLSLLLAASSLIQTGTVRADPPPWAPAYGYRAKHHHHHHHDHGAYQYYYYPAEQVYYSPNRRVYYYQNNGAWVNGVILPPRIHLGRYVSVDLGTPIPYSQHTTVIQSYPVIVP